MQPLFSNRYLWFITPLNLVLTLLFVCAVVFSLTRYARATTPDPGHAFSDVDLNQVTKTSSATLTATDTVVLADATAGAITLTLPSAVATTPKQVYFIKKIDTALANLVTINTTSAQTIDGLTSVSLAQRGESIALQSDGANWRILARRQYDLSAFRAKGSTLNQWYLTPSSGAGASGTSAYQANWLYAAPFIISKVTTIDQLGINVTTAGSASTPRVGIYADDGNSYPGALVVDAGTQSGATTGAKVYTTNLPVTLDPGLYWLVYITNATAPTIRSISASFVNPVMGFASTLPTAVNLGWQVSVAFGALPATYPTGANIININGVPAFQPPAVYVHTSQ